MDNKEILAVHSLLHQIYHRNKNQHSRAAWWKSLSMLKRITLDLATASSVSNSNAYRQHLALHLAPKCYLAFSTVAADKQFATLGIVLLAALARLAKATGLEFEEKKDLHKSTRKVVIVAPVEEDRGERLGRDEIEPLLKAREKPFPKSSTGSVDRRPKDSNSKKTTKKKKNAIDDLFSGLL